MKLTIELFKDKRYSGGEDTFFRIRLDNKGRVYQKEELLQEDLLHSIFDRIFDRAKEEIRKLLESEP